VRALHQWRQRGHGPWNAEAELICQGWSNYGCLKEFGYTWPDQYGKQVARMNGGAFDAATFAASMAGADAKGGASVGKWVLRQINRVRGR
jgi:hypothetical protein